ncbi:AlwI family type II restriction endonuclease [Staphylococcus capitis]|uniref:AlwI family type II restriction endonuclease n=1 Tax=Staphylococcus capitis TaxID=29388 RepID=UPI001642AB59|nr:AlwI family type II restriction endonuclease [Staphylococcus capitis]MBC3080964.1 AlwI family type II restriction endonuclease [Staphylococcus capitis]MDS3989098.1 AlwI family type II restriction endonuclease [Staphylococcus capitis]
MGRFESRTIFFSTSPRNPELIPKYLRLIREKDLENKLYNETLQIKFYDMLSQANLAGVSNGGKSKDKAFAGRDKLTRAPQALGFLIPKRNKPLKITEAGNLLMKEALFEDVMIHQLLKFQLPSALHKETKNKNEGRFNIKPFLEIIRLVYELEYLTYQELSIFGITMTDYRKFNETKQDVLEYRAKRKNSRGNKSLKKFYEEKRNEIFKELYIDILDNKNYKVRENTENSQEKFLKTKLSNSLDYTDSIFRFLRATGLFVLTKGKSISISNERIKEVQYILKNVERDIVSPDISIDKYFKYLSNPNIPKLKNDDLREIQFEIESKGIKVDSDDLYSLKEELNRQRVLKREQKLLEIKKKLKRKDKEDVEDIIETYSQIIKNEIPDRSAVMEWNTWRAAVMINNGDITGNFIPDDNGYPISTAGGSKGDIVGDYGSFNILYEVTLSQGKKQYDMEGEPVPRHVGELKKKSGKDTFGFFIAEKINPESVYHFYLTTGTNSKIYNGNISVIPINLSDFIHIFKLSIEKNIQPSDFLDLHNYSINMSRESIINGENEEYWYDKVMKYILNKVS